MGFLGHNLIMAKPSSLKAYCIQQEWVSYTYPPSLQNGPLQKRYLHSISLITAVTPLPCQSAQKSHRTATQETYGTTLFLLLWAIQLNLLCRTNQRAPSLSWYQCKPHLWAFNQKRGSRLSISQRDLERRHQVTWQMEERRSGCLH